MADFIVMPKLGFDMREGVLVGWMKQVGEQVARGEVVAEIESDKATLELEAQVAGTLLRLLAEPDDVVPVGANLAIVGEQDEDISGLANGGAAAPAAAAPVAGAAAVAGPAAVPAAAAASAEAEALPGGVRATPVARRLAQEHQLDLGQLQGSGPEGRIRKADVEAFLRAAPAPVEAVAGPLPAGADSTEVATSRLRQAIARRMSASKSSVPHFYVTTTIDMGPALSLRQQINQALEERGIKVTVNDMVVKAVGLALRQFPNLNASFAGANLLRHRSINVGSAVAVEGGLLTVVQKETDRSSLAQIAQDNREMVGRARAGKMRPEDITGGTFTVSNLGAYQVDHFIAIINPPEAAILAVGAAQQVPVVVDGALAVGSRMQATISADHRVTDGAEAARFNQLVKQLLENPLQLLL